MKRFALFLLGFLILVSNPAFAAEEAVSAETQAAASVTTEEAAPAPVPVPDTIAEVPVESTIPAEGAAPVEEPEPAVAALAENLEFISGEITAIDESAQSVTVKLYGETENEANDKILSVTL